MAQAMPNFWAELVNKYYFNRKDESWSENGLKYISMLSQHRTQTYNLF